MKRRNPPEKRTRRYRNEKLSEPGDQPETVVKAFLRGRSARTNLPKRYAGRHWRSLGLSVDEGLPRFARLDAPRQGSFLTRSVRIGASCPRSCGILRSNLRTTTQLIPRAEDAEWRDRRSRDRKKNTHVPECLVASRCHVCDRPNRRIDATKYQTILKTKSICEPMWSASRGTPCGLFTPSRLISLAGIIGH
jgi:hypothetical protein